MTDVPDSKVAESLPCPKRLWVLAFLADDEALTADEPLPAGLQFHLHRCPSCREEAEKLKTVSANLRALGSHEPEIGLRAKANLQAKTALADGARPSGLVDVAALEDFLPLRRRRWLLPRIGGWAAAAVLGLAVGLFWFVESPAPRSFQSVRKTRIPTSPAKDKTDLDFTALRSVADARESQTEAISVDDSVHLCRNLPYVDGEGSDDSNCVQPAFRIPRSAPPALGYGFELGGVDKSPSKRSTTR